MSKFGVMVMGPAGAGKSTFCGALLTHLNLNRRSAFYVNLDPAAEHFEHTPDLDIRDLISLEDVMEEMGLGPNGGLIYCFEFLMENLDFLTEALEPLTEEYLIVFDMPGQIELYTHVPILPSLVRFLSRAGALDIRLCAAYLLEANFVLDRAKYFAGSLSAMSAMILLEIPHLNILSKMDTVRDQVRKKDLQKFLVPDTDLLDENEHVHHDLDNDADFNMHIDHGNPLDRDQLLGGASFARLNRAVAKLIESFSMVSYLKLDARDEESVGGILSYIDDCIQFNEAQEPKELKDEEFEEPEE